MTKNSFLEKPPFWFGSTAPAANCRSLGRVRKLLLFGSFDNLILQGLGQVAEEVAISGYTNDEIPKLLGLRLSCAKRLRPDHVELDVVAVDLEIWSARGETDS